MRSIHYYIYNVHYLLRTIIYCQMRIIIYIYASGVYCAYKLPFLRMYSIVINFCDIIEYANILCAFLMLLLALYGYANRYLPFALFDSYVFFCVIFHFHI